MLLIWKAEKKGRKESMPRAKIAKQTFQAFFWLPRTRFRVVNRLARVVAALISLTP
jgi:hypothetical protein